MSVTSANVVQKAEEYATRAHAGQFMRNQTRDPFIEHPRKVVHLVELSGATDDELAAAWLHDIVEDTPVTLEDIEREFGLVIKELVDGLTDPPHFEGNPSHLRKKWQADRVKDKSAGVKRVKIADQTVNTYGMGFTPPIGWPPEERRAYVEGAKWIVDECRGVSEYLENLFNKTYEEAMRAIDQHLV